MARLRGSRSRSTADDGHCSDDSVSSTVSSETASKDTPVSSATRDVARKRGHRRTASMPDMHKTDLMALMPKANPAAFRRSDLELPAHAMRDSLFYSQSGFIDFRGFKNLALLCLFFTCFRLVFENLRNYGVLV